MELEVDEEEIQKNFPSDEEISPVTSTSSSSSSHHLINTSPPLSPEAKRLEESAVSATNGENFVEETEKKCETDSASSSSSSSDSEPVPPRRKRRRARKLSTTEESSEGEKNIISEDDHSPTVQVQHNSFPAPNNFAFKIQKTCFLSLCALRDYRIDPDGGIANVYFEGVTIPQNHIGNIIPVEDLKAKNVDCCSTPLLLFGDSRKKGFWLKFQNNGKDRIILRHSQALVFLYLTKAEPFFVTHNYRYESASQAQSMGLPIEGTTFPWERKESSPERRSHRHNENRRRSRSPPKCRRPPHRRSESETWQHEQGRKGYNRNGGGDYHQQERRQKYFPSRQQSSYHSFHSAAADYVDSDNHRARHGLCENYGWRHSRNAPASSNSAQPAADHHRHYFQNSKYYF